MSPGANWVAVLGGASCYTPTQLRAAYVCGRELARRGHHVITGATSGVPCAAAFGAKDGGGLVVGISPARSDADHVGTFRKPLEGMDLVIYSGLGLDGRAPLILRSVGSAVFIGGEMGTLAEFAAGWLCGCPVLGLLEETGGVTADLRRISASMTSWGGALVTARDPIQLVDRVLHSVVRDATTSPDAEIQDVLDVIAEFRAC